MVAAVRFLTNAVVASVDDQRSAVDDCVGDFESCLLVDFRDRRPGDLHLTRALFMRALLQVDQSHGFVLLDKQNDGRARSGVLRQKASNVRLATNAATATWSGHDSKNEH